MAFTWRAIVHLERGEIARAEECNDEVFALFEVRGESFGLGRAAAQRARLLAETGDPEAAAGQLICDGRVRKSQHPVGRMPAKHLARRVLCESWDALETPSRPSTLPWQTRGTRVNGFPKQSCCGLGLCSSPASTRRSICCARRSRFLAARTPNRWNCERPPSSLEGLRPVAAATRYAPSFPASTAGSPKDSTPATCRRRKRCWRNWPKASLRANVAIGHSSDPIAHPVSVHYVGQETFESCLIVSKQKSISVRINLSFYSLF
jgi:hypothetical protein